MLLTNTNQTEVESNEEQAHLDEKTFLIFRASGELFGVPLLGIKEVIKPAAVTPVPGFAPHFLGMLDLRGRLVHVMDLRLRLGMKTDGLPPGLILVLETPTGLVGAMVDDIVSVEVLTPEAVEGSPVSNAKFPTGSGRNLGQRNAVRANEFALLRHFPRPGQLESRGNFGRT
jgi:chemotaxis signal transduction protein